MVRLADGKRIKAQIWDTGISVLIHSGSVAIPINNSRVWMIVARHYRKALGALVVYDITKYESF